MLFRKISTKIFLLLVTLITLFPVSVQAAYTVPTLDIADAATKARIEEGKKLFKANCASCHKVDQKMTGPALKDVWTRWESQAKLISWVKNSAALIASGDPYAVKIFNEYNKSAMSVFPQLSDEQVISIIDYYVQAEGAGLLSDTPKKDNTGGGEGATTTSGGGSKWTLAALIGFLLIIAYGLWSVTSRLDQFVQEKNGENVTEKKSITDTIFNRKNLSAAVIIGVIALGFNIVNGAIDLGRSQGYKPEQPIKFSHALHAGQNKIECQYCHSGVEKSRHAVIPSVSVCMNCHKYVVQGPKHGKTEIAKIYEYAGWDPEKSDFTNAPKPIEWVKIHNLPDHVYFNHAQHVKVGGVACQTCHGNVQEMEVVEQYAPLSMGWCINCHRQTEVQFADNKYYSIFEKYHDEIKAGKRSKVTVEHIGGTECQKCHY
jgi:mono/diheme cytochrome c family protein